MNSLKLTILAILIHVNVFSQTNNEKKLRGAEPYPAPVSYENISLEQAEFIKLFEDKDVSNLHVYPLVKQEKESAFLQGKTIDSGFSNLLEGFLSKQTFVTNAEPKAVFRIRGEGEEYYIIRLPIDVSGGEIALYGWNNGKLEKKQKLASYSCKRNHCTQVDSWIQDVNGDTRLDIVQIKKTTRKNGMKVRIDKVVYLMDNNGLLKKSNGQMVDFSDYQTQNLSL